MSAIYGEGEKALGLGRLLAHILAVSEDTSILAWTGQSGGHNSCLPAHITVFTRPATSHLPQLIDDREIFSANLDLDLATKLYDRLNDFPAPWFAASRMKLPCIAFKLPPLSLYRARSGRVFRVDTPTFGMVDIKTKLDPTRLESLYLVHPWLDVLLDCEETQIGTFAEDEEASLPDTNDEDDSDAEGEDDSDAEVGSEGSPPLREHNSASPLSEDMAPMDRETRALRLISRLRQPFGALLLSATSRRRRTVVYKRVAVDSLITVQLRQNVSLSDIMENVRVLDVL